MNWNMHILWISLGLLYIATPTYSYVTGSLNVVGCQGYTIPINPCNDPDAVFDIQSISVLTSDDIQEIQNSGKRCFTAMQCRRTIHSPEDTGLSGDYIYLYNWILNRCNGKPKCDDNSTMPEWWALTDDFTECGQGHTQHFVGALLDIKCRVGDPITTVTPPPETTPKTRPTTPSTTTSFPVAFDVYLLELNGRERVVIGVAVGLAIAILIVLLIVLHCCERYRSNRKIAKLLRMLGAPQAQNDGFDDFEDYAKSDAWKEETNAEFDALGEYTGVKPNEFMTLDKKAMESFGQIMYDSNTQTMTMSSRGNSCSTLSKNGRISSHPSGAPVNYAPSGNMNYDTDENLDLERRMAETLNSTPDYEEDTSYH